MISPVIYSFVVPIYNDAWQANKFCLEFERTFQNYLEIDNVHEQVELIFVDDGSREESRQILHDLCKRCGFVKIILLSRNFGQHIALSCGYQYSTGQYVGMLNVDMEDPPDQIPLLLEHLKYHNLDFVVGIRDSRQSSFMINWSSRTFNFLINKLTGYDMPLNVATLRVMNRRFTDAYNSLSEKNRYLPGLEMWLGFKRGYVPIRHQRRSEGQSTYSVRKRFLLAVEAIISFSDLPLRITAMTGFIIAFLGFLLGGFLIIQKLFFIELRPGYTSTTALLVFFGGAQIFTIGMASIYIGRILKEVQNRPLYVIYGLHGFNYDP